MIDIPALFFSLNLLFIIRLLILAMIFVYIIFSVIVVVQARAFHRIVYIGDSYGSFVIQLLALVHLLASISLFLIALAIL